MKKSRACFADGGQISKADQLIAEMNAKYGVSGNSPAPAPVVQQPAPQPQAPKLQSKGLIGDALNLFGNRQKQIDKAAGYANGGLIGNAAQYWQDDNAKFEQASPNIGQRILRGINPITGFGSAMGAMKSAAEQGSIPGMGMALIQAIPAAGMIRTMPAVGAVKASVAPSVARTAVATGGGATANAIADDVQQRTAYRNGGKIKGTGTPTSDSIPAQVQETGEQIKVSTTERILSAAQDAMLEDMARKSGFESLDAMLEAGTGQPVGPTIKGGKMAAAGGWNIDNKPDEYNKSISKVFPPVFNDAEKIGPSSGQTIAGGMISPVTNFFADSAEAARGDKPYEQIRAERTASAGGIASPPPSSSATKSANPVISAISVNPFWPEKERFPLPDQRNEFITGKDGAMPDSSGGGFTQGGKSYNVNPSGQEGIARVTAPVTSPLYTNIDPAQGVAGLKNQTIGQPADQEAQGLARIANANKVRGEMIDSMIAANGGNGIAILPEQQPASQRMSIADIQSAMKSAGTRTERAAYGQMLQTALSGQTQLEQEAIRQGGIAAGHAITARGQDINKQQAMGHDQVLMRGQDMASSSEAAKNKILEEQSNRKGILSPIAVSGGEVADPSDPMGQRKLKMPNSVYDPNTGTWHTQPQGSAAQQAPEFKSKDELQAAIKAGTIKSGQTVMTPNGPMVVK